MPNNNPHGHNQYTRPELRSQRSKKPAAPPSGSPHSQPPESSGGSEAHESQDSQESSHESGSRQDARGMAEAAEASGSSDVRDAAPMERPPGTSRRGFASMDAALQREIASKGGHSQGRQNNPGNFANDRERARAAGRKGGEAHGHR